MKIRRQDRLLEKERTEELLAEGEYGFLALGSSDNLCNKEEDESLGSGENCQGGYGVPLNYVWDGESLWFHCAPEGEKLERIRGNDRASFCVVGKTQVQSSKFTTAYESVMLFGKVEIVEADGDKFKVLEMILDKYSPEDKVIGLKYAEKSFHRTAVLRLRVERITAKAKVMMGQG